MISESDTESASETGKVCYFNDPKTYCRKYGNGMEETLPSQHEEVNNNQSR